MKNLKNLIEHIFTKKNIKIFLLLFIVVSFFVWSSFAAETTDTTSPVDRLSYSLHIFISISSWVWIILATLAWKLMTNDFVYWSFLHLDKVLWDLWNVMKNFANFTLWFILIFTIIKNLFKWSFDSSKGDPVKATKDTIIHTLIAWVLVQMSWFLMAAMLDLSTIATAAVWAIPSQFMASDTGFLQKVGSYIEKTNQKLVIDLSSKDTIEKTVRIEENPTKEDINEFLDTIMPGPDSVAWTFIFLWASVFNLFELSDTSTNESWTDDIWDLILSLWINWFVLLSFSLMLALIFVFNLFRVITLWMIIPLMPFVILVAVFSKGKDDKIKWFLGDVLNYQKIVKLVFKPVYMTLVLSIILIVMVLIRSLAKANGGFIDLSEQNNMTVESKQDWSGYDSYLDVANIAAININWRESIVDLLVYFIWLALMIVLMKSCVSWEITWIKFIDDKVGNLSKFIWWWKGEFGGILWKTWVIPIWGTKVWIWTLASRLKRWDALYNLAAKQLWIDTGKQDNAMRNWLKIETGNFASLNGIVNKDKWLAEAVKIWKSKYTTLNQLWNDEKFRSAWSAYNNKNSANQISNEDIQKAWDEKKSESWTSNNSWEWWETS